MAITRINKFIPAPKQSEALWAFLNELQVYISQSKGCLSCEVFRNEIDALKTDSDERNHFFVIEKWQSKTDHQQSLANYPKDKMQAAMPLIGAPPEGDYYL